MITHYGLFRSHVPNSPMIKVADFFTEQGGLTENWGTPWEPIEDCTSIGHARRTLADKHGVTLSHIFQDEP